MILLTCSQLRENHESRSEEPWWRFQIAECITIHQSKLCFVSSFWKMNLFTCQQLQENHRSRFEKPRWKSQKTQSLTIHQPQLEWVSDFMRWACWLAHRCNSLIDLKSFGKGLKRLNSIRLYFPLCVTFITSVCLLTRSCYEITNQGLKNLGESLNSALQSIDLNFKK